MSSVLLPTGLCKFNVFILTALITAADDYNDMLGILTKVNAIFKDRLIYLAVDSIIE